MRYLEGKSNVVADWLSRPPGVPLGTAYQMQTPEVDTIESTYNLEIIDHKQLAADQKVCKNVRNFRSGLKPPNTKMADIEFSPGVTLYCRQYEEGCQARPLVPENW